MAEKALIAMSGGVDSSVAAFLTKEQGFDISGVTLRMFGNDLIGENEESACCSTSDVEDAGSVCRRLGVPFHVFNFSDQFEKEVVRSFVRAYEEGKTPNPCIDCNRYLKFGALFSRMKELGYDHIVTGHYARVEQAGADGRDRAEGAEIRDCNETSGAGDPDKLTCAGIEVPRGRYILRKAVDPRKDQSYVLYSLTQEQLAHVMFPLGGMTKDEVRKTAEEQGFVNANKHDSQDICFVPDGDYAGFIRRYTGKEYPAGDFVDEEGRVLGEHKGIIRYTVGQRKGLGLALPAPLYVCGKDVENNRVVLAPNDRLFSRTVSVSGFNWIAFPDPAESAGLSEHVGHAGTDRPEECDAIPGSGEHAGYGDDAGCDRTACTFRASVKVRYSQKESAASITSLGGGKVRIDFDQPVRAVTPGQAAVVYDGDIVIGGGTIE